ncbi:flagellar assembly protein A [Campylobacter helveticus]|uniref:flagellar assembly protein A n=1 Tax=Campylobacter helveticus TaxID=28898 RepID=UPI001112BA6F|nr:flagellar assembly protein A [Campylobacter helveticus]TNB65892.1 DUF342 domain-containing protein [Campylobacter helveticus]TNH36136.1 DUF342 domain-containing protein [Campylobacter helveticus]TNH37347.1 DUF342 domain-containing protein [Campylobacter helveticus]
MANFDNVVTYTENPYKEMLSVASRTGLSVQELDFKLLAFSTQFRFGEGQWQKIAEKELVKFDDDEVFLKKDLQIKQEYKIEIYQSQENDIYANAIKLVANKNLTKIIAQIDLKTLVYEEKIAIKILQNIYKKMLKLKFLIGIRIFNFKKELLELLSKHKSTPIKQIVQITIAKGVEPTQSQDEALILCYKDKAKNYTLDEQRADIITVGENEVVLRHLKAKNGKKGKDINLHILEVLEPKENKINFSCSNAFKREEKEEFVEYIALKKGFVVENANNYDIANELEYGAVDFKSVGVIRAGLDKNVKINIKFTSDMQDAVNSGVGIECEELNISGSVAGNTNLKATRLRIDGTTHTKAKIYAKEGYIKTHRGAIDGENISVDLLEGGSIKAKVVRIKKSLGGNVEADKIYIESLATNNTCTFFENVIVERFEGDNNKFFAKVKTLDKDYEEEFKNIDDELFNFQNKMQNLKQSILVGKSAVATLEMQIQKLRENKQKIPDKFLKMLEDYAKLNEELQKLTQMQKELLEKKANLNEELLRLQDALLNAKLINRGGKWSDMNEVRFFLIAPKNELFFASSADEAVRYIGLKKSIQNNKELVELEKKIDYDEKDIQWLSPSKG